MADTLPQPDVLVEQLFEEPEITLIPPALPVVIIGVNKQIEFRQSGGAYDGTSTAFLYPNLISGSVVDQTSVKVHLVSTLGVFELLPADLTITASDVTVGADAEVSKKVVDQSKTGQTSSTTTVTAPPLVTDGVTTVSTGEFSSILGTFVADGVVPGMTLKLVDGTDAGEYEVESVTSETALVVKLKPWEGFTGFAGATLVVYLIPQDSTVFTDASVDFFKSGVVPNETLISLETGTDKTTSSVSRQLQVDKILSATTLQLNAQIINSATGDISGVVAIMTDPSVDFVALGAKIGDKLIIEAGVNEGVHSIIGVTASDLTVSADFTGLQLLVEYHVSAVLAGETSLQYSAIRTTFEETGTILVTYDAVRNDNIGKLVQMQTTTDIQTKLGPAIPENPLAFGAFLAGLNTDTTLFATAVAADTVTDFTTAAEFLETEEVYAIIPLTQDAATAQIFSAHVTQQSDVDSKHERIVFINRELFVQTTRMDEDPADTGALLTDETSPTLDTFADTSVNFTIDGVIQGDVIEFTHTTGGVDTTESTRVFSRDSDTALTLIDGLTGTFITDWNTAAGSGDAQYSIKSAALDKFEQADFIADFSASFANRRVHNVWPDLVEITFGDSTQTTTFLTQDELAGIDAPLTGNFTEVHPGYFLGSMIGGMIPGNTPEQPFTNFNIVGAVGLRNSNRYFTGTQLDTIATGGTYIVVQDVVDGPAFSRHQLSTDVSQIEKQELSITKTVDFVSKFFRINLRPYIGKFNITQIYLEQVRAVADGILTRLVEDGTLIDGNIVKLEQSTTQSDTVLLEVDILVPFPANFIRVTLLI
jgi:hypothetical protein